MNVFELMAVLSIDSSGFMSGLGMAEKGALQFGSVAMSAVTSVVGIVTDGMSQATDAVVDFAKESVNTGMDFDKSMSQVAATMGLTVDQLDKEVGSADTSFGHFEGTLRDFAKYMGSNTVFSATQAADALNYMALAGYDTQESMDMLPNVLSLAAAGNMDLARASDMVTDAQTALGLTAQDTMVMVDQMAKTASTTNTSVSQLGDAILTIGGTAQFMAGGTEELTAVLGILADNGIKASEAGTHLRNMILKLSSPTEKGAGIMEELGLSVYDAEGQMRSFEDIFTDLSVAMADFTDEQKVQAFTDLFNARDVASATAILNTTAERWAEVKGAIDGAQGSAAQMAETQLDNLAGDITLFKSALEGVQIILSDQLTPTIRDIVQLGTGALQAFSDGFQEGGIEGAISGVIDYIAEKLPEVATKVVEMIPTIVSKVVELIQKVGPELISLLVNDVLPTLMEMATSLMADYLEMLPDILEQSVDIMSEVIPKIIDFVVQMITVMSEAMVDLYPMITEASIQILTVIINALLSNLPELLRAVLLMQTAIINGIIAMIPSFISAVIQIVMQCVATLVELVPTLINTVIEIAVSLLTNFVDAILKFISEDYWFSMFDNIIKSFKDIDWDGVGGFIMNGIIDGLVKGWNDVKNTVTNIADGIKNAFTGSLDIHSPSKVFKYYGEMIDEGLADGIVENGASIDATESLANDVEGAFDGSIASQIGIANAPNLTSGMALAGAGGFGDLVIPVYLGTDLLDTVVVKAIDRANYISGGR